MKVNDSKTVKGVTVVIRRIAATVVYYRKFCACGCGVWRLQKRDRADFERQWEAA